MAIDRMFQCTMAHGNLGEWDYAYNARWSTGGAGTGNRIQTDTSYGHNCDWRKYFRKKDGTRRSTQQIRGGMYIYHGSCDGGSGSHLMRIYTTSMETLVVELRFTAINNSTVINLYVNGVWKDNYTLPYQTWYHMGWDIKKATSGGWVKFYKNGEEILSFEGDTLTNGMTVIQFGPSSGGISDNFDWFYICHFYCDDSTGETAATAPPVLKFYTLRPTGNGNYSQWTGSDGDSTDNYLLVDESAASGSDYVYSTVADQYDSYAMANTPAFPAGSSVAAYIPTSLSRRYGVTEEIAIGTRLSSTDSIGTDMYTQIANYHYHCWDRQTTKPGGGSWTSTDVDNAEIVQKSRGTY